MVSRLPPGVGRCIIQRMVVYWCFSLKICAQKAMEAVAKDKKDTEGHTVSLPILLTYCTCVTQWLCFQSMFNDCWERLSA